MAYTSTRSSTMKILKITLAMRPSHTTYAFKSILPNGIPAFRLYRMRARTQRLQQGSAYELLLDLFETKIEQILKTLLKMKI